MSTTTDPRAATRSHDLLADVADRLAITDLLHRWGAHLDDQRFDALVSAFAADATISTPGGQAEGLGAIRAQAVRNHIPEVATQHRASDLVIDLDGDRATARANYVGVFAQGQGRYAPPSVFQVGSVYRFELVRTPDGWRIRSLQMEPVWADGERPY